MKLIPKSSLIGMSLGLIFFLGASQAKAEGLMPPYNEFVPAPTPTETPVDLAIEPVPAPTNVASEPVPAPTQVVTEPVPAPIQEVAENVPAPQPVAEPTCVPYLFSADYYRHLETMEWLRTHPILGDNLNLCGDDPRIIEIIEANQPREIVVSVMVARYINGTIEGLGNRLVSVTARSVDGQTTLQFPGLNATNAAGIAELRIPRNGVPSDREFIFSVTAGGVSVEQQSGFTERGVDLTVSLIIEVEVEPQVTPTP